MACRTCELECAVSHSETKNLLSALFEEPRPQKRIFVERSGDLSFPLQCRHCEEPPCQKVCPTDALSKSTSADPVLLDEERCIGCKFCVIACPFGVVVLHRDNNKIIKCDLCSNLEDQELPRCVQSCPTNALEYIPSEELTKKKRREFMVEFTDDIQSSTKR